VNRQPAGQRVDDESAADVAVAASPAQQWQCGGRPGCRP
jgi:hypothetical protein